MLAASTDRSTNNIYLINPVTYIQYRLYFTQTRQPGSMAAAARRLTEAVKLLLVEDYGKLDKRVPHLLELLRERGADYCWHKVWLWSAPSRPVERLNGWVD